MPKSSKKKPLADPELAILRKYTEGNEYFGVIREIAGARAYAELPFGGVCFAPAEGLVADDVGRMAIVVVTEIDKRGKTICGRIL